jgi:hypothetical protein
LLSEISLYTYTGKTTCRCFLRAIAVKEKMKVLQFHQEDNDTLILYFETVVPDYDKDRVYASDIKKVLNWYNILQAKGLVSKEEPKVENAEAVKRS